MKQKKEKNLWVDQACYVAGHQIKENTGSTNVSNMHNATTFRM